MVDVLVVGAAKGVDLHRLPAQPPSTLDQIYLCNAAEVVRFTERNDWLRTVLGSVEVPADQLLSPHCARSPGPAAGSSEPYRVSAGRELASLWPWIYLGWMGF